MTPKVLTAVVPANSMPGDLSSDKKKKNIGEHVFIAQELANVYAPHVLPSAGINLEEKHS